MAAMAKQIASYPLIKLKLGSDDDESRVRAVRQARPDAKLCVDANAGWTLDEAIDHLKWLEKYDIELIEQPLPKDQHAGLGEVQKAHRDPRRRRRIGPVAGRHRTARPRGACRGVNLKIMKVGGVLPGLAIVRRARELNMKIMLGCMIESFDRHHRRRALGRPGRLARPRRAAADQQRSVRRRPLRRERANHAAGPARDRRRQESELKPAMNADERR
jgi:L-alanine-DL-glutamate epimerase-like enolase superfamily enzyme